MINIACFIQCISLFNVF